MQEDARGEERKKYPEKNRTNFFLNKEIRQRFWQLVVSQNFCEAPTSKFWVFK